MRVQELYERVKALFPDTTTRLFSRYCGMSDGYYGSVVAQGLQISNEALLILAQVLEHKRELECAQDGAKAAGVRALQEQIAQMVATRSQPHCDGSVQVNRMLLRALAKLCYERECQSTGLGFVVGWR
jgi:hypothetical protein